MTPHTHETIAFSMPSDEYKLKDVNPNAIVRQSNHLINGRWRMTLNQSRIFLTAVSMVEFEDDEFERYRIKGKQLKDLIDLKGHSFYDQLKKDVGKLMATYIHVKREDEKGKKYEDFISLVSSARYIDGEGDLLIRFDPGLKPYLLGLKKNFTQIKLLEAMKVKSMYALRLFLLLKQFDSSGWRYMDVAEIRDSLALNKAKDNDLKTDLYPAVADLKKRVLNPAVSELNKTGFKVSMEQQKDGRKIKGFRFVWHNDASAVQETIQLQSSKDEASQRAIKRLTKLGLNQRQIKYLLTIVPLQEVSRTCYGIEMTISDGKVRSDKVGGYTYKTFKQKFQLKEF
ncbi:MAG: replication initiation protein [Reichenbachiella sp.]